MTLSGDAGNVRLSRLLLQVFFGVNGRKLCYGTQDRSEKVRLMRRLKVIVAFFAIVILRPLDALAWNIPGHMLTGAIAYQILRREAPTAISTVRSVLEKNPWYETRW